MSDIKTIEGDFTGGKGNYTIVVGRWNSFVVEHLLEGAIDCLRRHGVSKSQITIVRAPGAFEIPLVCKKVAAKGYWGVWTQAINGSGGALHPDQKTHLDIDHQAPRPQQTFVH
mgnify:CR=1 FL=1